MLLIRSSADIARALDSPIDADLKGLLTLRRDQLLEYDGYETGELAHFIVAEPGDTAAQIEVEAGRPILTSPAFEWVRRHDGWYEATAVLSDDGFGIVLFVPVSENVDPAILTALSEHLMTDRCDNSSPHEGGNPQGN